MVSRRCQGGNCNILARALTEYLERLLPREHLQHGRDGSIFSSTSKQISSRGIKAVYWGEKIQRKNNVRILLKQRPVKKNRLLLVSQKIRVASEQSGIRLNYPAHTSVSLKPGWILTS